MTQTLQERVEFAIGGILALAKEVEVGFRDAPKDQRLAVADKMRYFADQLQAIANGERRNGHG